MKKAAKKLWTWILSGLALMLGVSSCFRIPSPKVYGPPPPENVTDSTTNTVNEIEEE